MSFLFECVTREEMLMSWRESNVHSVQSQRFLRSLSSAFTMIGSAVRIKKGVAVVVATGEAVYSSVLAARLRVE